MLYYFFPLAIITVNILAVTGDVNCTQLTKLTDYKKTHCPWIKNNTYYTGGSTHLYTAGDLSPFHKLRPEKVPPTLNWPNREIFEYRYSVYPTPSMTLRVECNCMVGLLCSCEHTDPSTGYFQQIIDSGDTDRILVRSARQPNSHILVINGTLELPAQDAFIAPISSQANRIAGYIGPLMVLLLVAGYRY